jgi:hypothetical protein
LGFFGHVGGLFRLELAGLAVFVGEVGPAAIVGAEPKAVAFKAVFDHVGQGAAAQRAIALGLNELRQRLAGLEAVVAINLFALGIGANPQDVGPAVFDAFSQLEVPLAQHAKIFGQSHGRQPLAGLATAVGEPGRAIFPIPAGPEGVLFAVLAPLD